MRRDRRPDARAGEPVDGVPRLLQLAQHADVGEGPGPAARRAPARGCARPAGRRCRPPRAAGRHRPRSAARRRSRPPRPPGPPARAARRSPPGPAGGRGTGRRPGTPLPARATRTTASDWRRQKSRHVGRHRARRRPPPARRGRSPASARARPSASTVPGVDHRQVRGQPRLQVAGRLARCRCPRAGRPRRSRAAAPPAPSGVAAPAVRIWPATWVSTARVARGSRSSRSSNAVRGTSMRVASRRARTPADRASPVSSESSPTTAPGVKVRTSWPPWTTSSRPLRSRYADPGGVALAEQPLPGVQRRSCGWRRPGSTRALSDRAATSGMSPRPIDEAVRGGSAASCWGSGQQQERAPVLDVLGLRPRGHLADRRRRPGRPARTRRSRAASRRGGRRRHPGRSGCPR